MNYYEHHLGDYMRDTAHLSIVEDGAYRRLLDAYYIREQPLPRDVRECCKLARTASKSEREAVAYVLRSFFELRDDGWHQARADAEIARFQDKQRKAKASAGKRWGKPDSDPSGPPNGMPPHVPPHMPSDMRTHSEGTTEGNAPRARPQTPIPRHQTEGRAETSPTPSRARLEPNAPREARSSADAGIAGTGAAAPPEQAPSPYGAACLAMRRAGLQATNPGDPRLRTLVDQGATPEEFAGLAAEAVKGGKGFAWVLVALENRRKQAADIRLAAPPTPTVTSSAADATQAYLASQQLTPEERERADAARVDFLRKRGKAA